MSCNCSFYRSLKWADVLLLTMLSQRFGVTLLYTPVVEFDYDHEIGGGKEGTFEKTIVPKKLNFNENHIYYLSPEEVNKALSFDENGLYYLRLHAYSHRVISVRNVLNKIK